MNDTVIVFSVADKRYSFPASSVSLVMADGDTLLIRFKCGYSISVYERSDGPDPEEVERMVVDAMRHLGE